MIRPIKRLGQNFLQDPNTARNIVSGLLAKQGDPVVEIGPGTGALTGILTDAFDRVTAIEVDDRAAEIIEDLWPMVDIRRMDILDVDWRALRTELEAPLHVIGNLPYYITTPILFDLLDAGAAGDVKEAVMMMQYEVAERLIAQPRTKQYGILSVAVQQAARAEILFPVSRNVFFPKPDVRSAVVRLTFGEQDPALQVDTAHLRTVVRTAFNQRRKTLRNSLQALTGSLGRELPEDVASKRAEELSPGDFVTLTRYLHGMPPRP